MIDDLPGILMNQAMAGIKSEERQPNRDGTFSEFTILDLYHNHTQLHNSISKLFPLENRNFPSRTIDFSSQPWIRDDENFDRPFSVFDEERMMTERMTTFCWLLLLTVVFGFFFFSVRNLSDLRASEIDSQAR